MWEVRSPGRSYSFLIMAKSSTLGIPIKVIANAHMKPARINNQSGRFKDIGRELINYKVTN
jgi:hypothetical protein